ncbi:MAG: hypothetical protein ACI87E_004105, partial [Mariniblastus sp.]
STQWKNLTRERATNKTYPFTKLKVVQIDAD